jgi:hypothetical protein
MGALVDDRIENDEVGLRPAHVFKLRDALIDGPTDDHAIGERRLPVDSSEEWADAFDSSCARTLQHDIAAFRNGEAPVVAAVTLLEQCSDVSGLHGKIARRSGSRSHPSVTELDGSPQRAGRPPSEPQWKL